MAADLEALAAGLATALGLAGPACIRGLKRLSGGASQETWAFEALQPEGQTRRQVLRRAPAGAETRGRDKAGLAAEARLIGLAAAAGVPVPTVRCVLPPEAGLGEGFVSDWLPGETLGARVAAAERPALAFQCGQALARIHALRTEGLADLGPDRAAGLRPDGAAGLRTTQPAAEVAHLRRWHARHGTVRPVFQFALRWLAEHAPADVAPTLVHGDFRNGNLMVDLAEDRLVSVLDWELAHLGDPMADLGWLCVASWRFGHPERPVGGFAPLAPLFEGYRAAGGRVDAARVHWWQVLGSLRWGVMCEGMGQAWLTGTEPVMERAAIARRASENEIDLLALLLPRPAAAAGAAPLSA